MSCYDPHLLVYKQGSSTTMSGLIAFNVDTMVQKQTQKITKVNLYHLSTLLGDDEYPAFVDAVLAYIWKHMHCSVIRLSLYHYEENGKLQVNPMLKNLLKTKGFKWKTVTNEAKTGSRIEIMESNNITMKEQINPMTCTLYRQGLKREDVHKEPFAFRI